jgi:hypothetical protein
VETTKPARTARIYRSRHPERTVLYRAFAQHFEQFLHVYEEHSQEKHGHLRRYIGPAVHRYLDCGIFDHKVARVRCPDCRHEFLEDVPHRQVVFTIPKRLRVFFRYDRKLLGELAGCAWRALKLYFEAYFDGAAVTPGAVGFVQTAGELLNFHPHVHVLVTDGGFTPDGAFRPLVWFDSRHVERLFRAELLRMLLDKELVTEAVVDNLLSWRHSGFSAHGAVRAEDRRGAVRLGRYMIRCPIVLERLAWDEGAGQVVCCSRPTRHSGPLPAEARRDVYEVDPLLCPFCGAEIGTRRRHRRGGTAATSAARLWADPRLHPRFRHRQGDP